MKEIKREQILDTARNVFSKYGYAKTTLDDIGEAVGMKKNSLYHYFSNKEELFKEVIRSDEESYYKEIQKTLKEEQQPSEKLHTFFTAAHKFWREKENLHNVTVSVKMEILSVVSEQCRGFIDRHISMIAEILKAGIDSGEFVKHDHLQLAKDINDMILALEYRDHQISKVEYTSQVNHEEHGRKILNLLNYIVRGLKKQQ